MKKSRILYVYGDDVNAGSAMNGGPNSYDNETVEQAFARASAAGVSSMGYDVPSPT